MLYFFTSVLYSFTSLLYFFPLSSYTLPSLSFLPCYPVLHEFLTSPSLFHHFLSLSLSVILSLSLNLFRPLPIHTLCFSSYIYSTTPLTMMLTHSHLVSFLHPLPSLLQNLSPPLFSTHSSSSLALLLTFRRYRNIVYILRPSTHCLLHFL